MQQACLVRLYGTDCKSVDKMQRQRRPWEWRIAGTNGPIRKRDFFPLRFVPNHLVAESIHALIFSAPPKRAVTSGIYINASPETVLL